VVNEDEGWNGEAATDILLRGCVIALSVVEKYISMEYICIIINISP
jgi:hypothetical protein